MCNRENIIAVGLLGAMILAVAGLFFATHYRALLHPGAPRQNLAAEAANPGGLNIPTVDRMCAAAGATAENMDQCKFDEQTAAEFVIAWMGLNGFIVNGTIDLEQIQLVAELGSDATSPLTDPDPSFLDPSLGGDPNAGDPFAEPNIDPATGLPVTETFESPAQIAMLCLSQSNDWLSMHDCIYRYDPSSRFTGQ